MTVQTLINSSLRLIGRLGPGRGAGPSESADALVVLNSMLDAWNADQLMIYNVAISTYALVASQQLYTMGPGGNFNTARPAQIENANILVVAGGSTTRVPVEIISKDAWAAIRVQAVSSSIPTKLYLDNAYPLAGLYLWPIPSAIATIELYTWQLLAAFATLGDTVSFPAGYADAVRYNLAVALAPEWGEAPRADVLMLARQTKTKLTSLNLGEEIMTPDPAFACTGGRGGRFNPLVGR